MRANPSPEVPYEVDADLLPDVSSLKARLLAIRRYGDSVIAAGEYLDDLADKGNKKANQIMKDWPETGRIEGLTVEILQRVSCSHPKSRCIWLTKVCLTACLQCKQVIKIPRGSR